MRPWYCACLTLITLVAVWIGSFGATDSSTFQPAFPHSGTRQLVISQTQDNHFSIVQTCDQVPWQPEKASLTTIPPGFTSTPGVCFSQAQPVRESVPPPLAPVSLEAISKADPSLYSATPENESYPGSHSTSSDGRYVVFLSNGRNVVDGQIDTNEGYDIFVFDRLTQTTRLVSGAENSTTQTGNNPSRTATISADGRFIVFTSTATNLVLEQVDTNAERDVFVFDQIEGTTRLISRVPGSTTQAGNLASFSPVISADGRFIAFASAATNLVPGQIDTKTLSDIFVFDQVEGATRLVSRVPGSPTRVANSSSFSPVINADGRFIAFESFASNLVPNQVDYAYTDIFVFDQVEGTTCLVSGYESSPNQAGDNHSQSPLISADGRYIAFQSYARRLIENLVDPSGYVDVFVFDQIEGTTRLVSGIEGSPTQLIDTGSYLEAMSPDGRFITFQSYSQQLVAGLNEEPRYSEDIFVFDREEGKTQLVSRAGGSPTQTGNKPSEGSMFSSDGRFILFSSLATDLVEDQIAVSSRNVFLFDRVEGITRLISRSGGSATRSANGGSYLASISENNRFITFSSSGNDFVPNDFNNNFDVFVYDQSQNRTELVSRRAPGLPSLTPNWGSETSSHNSVSQDGRYMVFISSGLNLVPGQVDSNDEDDVFLYDRVAGTTRLVSGVAGSPTHTGKSLSTVAVISGNGRYVAFVSSATNLVTGQVDSGFYDDIFVFDQVEGTTRLVTGVRGSLTRTARHGGKSPAISHDGRFIAFESYAQNLVVGQVDEQYSDIFVFDQVTGTTRLVSGVQGSATRTADFYSQSPKISADGRFIVFESSARNLVNGQIDSDYSPDIFVFDQVAGTTRLVSGIEGSALKAGNGCEFPSMSADGRFIAFSSYAQHLVAGQVDQDGTPDIFVFDQVTGTTRLVSGVDGSPTQTGDGSSRYPVMSADGRSIVFGSDSTNLVTGQVDPNRNFSNTDLFVFDRVGEHTRLVSGINASATHTPNNYTSSWKISADGRFIAFSNFATNLIDGQVDQQKTSDIFVFDQLETTIRLVSRAEGSETRTGNLESTFPVISADGRFIAFESGASDLVAGDFNTTQDVFLGMISGCQATTGMDQEVCLGTSTTDLDGNIPPPGASGIWSATPSVGAFSPDASVPHATYTPPPGFTGEVFLTWTITGGSCDTPSSKKLKVQVFPRPTVEAGLDQTVCAENPVVRLNAQIGGSATRGLWVGGAGEFRPDQTSPTAVYTPTRDEIRIGTLALTFLTDDPPGPCEAVSDTVTVFIQPSAMVNAGPDKIIVEGDVVPLVGTFGGSATSVLWSGGSGAFSPDPTSPIAIYTPSAAELSAGTVTLTLSTNDPPGPCSAVFDTVTIKLVRRSGSNAIEGSGYQGQKAEKYTFLKSLYHFGMKWSY